MKKINKERKIKPEKLDKLYQSVITSQKDKTVKKRLSVFDSPIYFDKRQYSIKIPRRIFDFIDYTKGDKLEFIIDETDPKKPKLSIQYMQVKK